MADDMEQLWVSSWKQAAGKECPDPGLQGKMESDKVAKVTHIPAPSVKKILAEMAERDLVREENGIWGLTGAGEEIEKELKKRG